MSIYDPKTPSKFNFVSVLMTVGLVAGAYFGVWYLPTYYSVWSFGTDLREVANAGYREHNDEVLMKSLLAKGAKKLPFEVKREHFRITRQRYSPAEINQAGRSANIALLKNRGKAITIELDRDVVLKYPLLNKSATKRFYKKAETSLEVVKY